MISWSHFHLSRAKPFQATINVGQFGYRSTELLSNAKESTQAATSTAKALGLWSSKWPCYEFALHAPSFSLCRPWSCCHPSEKQTRKKHAKKLHLTVTYSIGVASWLEKRTTQNNIARSTSYEWFNHDVSISYLNPQQALSTPLPSSSTWNRQFWQKGLLSAAEIIEKRTDWPDVSKNMKNSI